MQDQFLQQLQELQIIGQKLLLAVSGGPDSVCLVHLAEEAGLDFGIAHCNFNLRDQESAAEASWVRQLAASLKKPFYCQSFDTKQYAALHKCSIQVAARELRYQWLEQIRRDFGYSRIATAHHINDSLETFLYNFSKGTGIKGLLGIPAIHNQTVRPLLKFTKDEILEYLHQNDIAYKIDSSNSSNHYARNLIRNEVVPHLKKINPALEETFRQTRLNLEKTFEIYRHFLNQVYEEAVKSEGSLVYIHKKSVQVYPFLETLLFEMLHPYGFSGSQIRNLVPHDKPVGNQYISSTHQLINDREFWIIKPLEIKENKILTWTNPEQKMTLGNGNLKAEHFQGTPVDFESDPKVGYFDENQISWPLQIRKWLPGDHFQPLGMHGHHKKIQDFFSDQKLSLFEKEDAWLLLHQREIAWVIGYRSSEKFKVATNTTGFWKLTFVPTS